MSDYEKSGARNLEEDLNHHYNICIFSFYAFHYLLYFMVTLFYDNHEHMDAKY